MKIKDIIINSRKRKVNQDKVKDLAESISKVGLINPICVTSESVLIAGNHRLEAFKLLGLETIEATIMDVSAIDAELIEIDENLKRSELNDLELGRFLQRRNEILEAQGLRAQVGFNGNQYTEKVGGETVSPPKSTSDIASEIGLSGRSVQHKIQMARDIAPDVQEVIEETGNASSTKALLEVARMPVEKQKAISEILKSENKPNLKKAIYIARENSRRESVASLSLPTGKYNVIYADPPWSYNNSGFSKSSANEKYLTLDIEEIKAFNVSEMASENCVLFMWGTNPLLKEAFDVLDAWGFEYKTNIVWVKSSKVGLGFYVHSQHEFLMIATKGSMRPNGERPGSVLEHNRTVHSKKPEEVYALIESMYPECKYLELFARNKRDGWEAYGNESDKFES